MFVVFRCNYDGASHKFKVGGKYDLPNEVAAEFIRSGKARPADDAPEVATVRAPEAAMRPAPEPRTPAAPRPQSAAASSPPKRRPGRPRKVRE